MKERTLWSFISEHLQKKHPVMLVTVMDFEKGSPGKTGFKMAVTAEEMCGTIGGGIMEFNILKKSRELLASGTQSRIVKHLVHNPNTVIGEPSGLICAGSQTVSLVSLSFDDNETVNGILSALRWYAPSHILLGENGLSFHMGKKEPHFSFSGTGAKEWLYSENVGAEYSVYVVGGGHVGLAVARLMVGLDFNVILIDDRPAAPAMEDVELQIRKIVAPYETIAEHIESGEKSFVAIVTASMVSDTFAFRSLLGKKFGYIGLMGTPAKIARILNSFSQEEKDQFQNLHAPIGLDINSKTAEEIAVSIAAEMIKLKNQQSD